MYGIHNRSFKYLAPVLCLVFLLAFSWTCYAKEVPEESTTGSISCVMKYNGSTVGGGTLTIYRVGAVAEDDGSYYFTVTDAFSGSGVSLEDLDFDSASALEETASILSAYAEAQNLSGTAVSIDSDGEAFLSDLTIGLYLVVQTEAADGYEACEPFLVSIPMYDESSASYLYDVDATVKTSLTPADSNTPTTDTDVPGTTTLPQTGQLNWPIPVMALLGLCLLFAGCKLRMSDAKAVSAG